MKSPLAKSDIAWLLVKFIGIYFIYSGMLGILGAIVLKINMQDALSDLPRNMRASTSSTLRGIIYIPFIILMFGLYFIKSGKFVYELLMSLPFGEAEIDASGVSRIKNSLNEHEQQQFEAWLEKNPELKKRSPSDLIALFRDAQKCGAV